MSETIGKPILPVFYDVKLVYSYFFLYILSSGKCKYQFQHCCGWPLIKISLEMLKGYKETLLWKWEELVQSYSCHVILKCKGKPWSSSKSVKIACWHVLAVPLMTSSAHFLNTYNDPSSAFFPVKVLHYVTQRSENLSLLKTASDLRYNQEMISLNKFLNFYKFEIVYTSLLDHHGGGICVTKGRLFTKHQCLRYSKVTDYKNRLKLSISSRLLKLYW